MLYSSSKAFSSSVILFSLSSPSCSNFILEMTLESPAPFLFRSSQIWCRLFSNIDGYRRFFHQYFSLQSLLPAFRVFYTVYISDHIILLLKYFILTVAFKDSLPQGDANLHVEWRKGNCLEDLGLLLAGSSDSWDITV